MVSFVDPRGRPGAATVPYDLEASLGDGTTIALMANGFPDSDTFLDHIADALSARLPSIRFNRYNKGNASKLAATAMLNEVAERCDAVVAAYGH